MQVGVATRVAEGWVREVAAGMPGFAGAFFHGGVTWLPDEAELPATSDLDLMIVVDGPAPEVKLGKVPVGGVLLDISYLARDEVRSAERVLGHYHLAGSLAGSRVIADPTGELTRLRAAVAAGYPRRSWVRRRAEQARDKVLNAPPLREEDALADQVTAWNFPAGVLTHVILVAALRNPTVRTRYLAAREALADYGYADLYPALLDLQGCRELPPERVSRHLDAVAEAFDAASAVVRTPVFFATDISAAARPIAIDGSRALIARGDHREAVFWIVATACRCQQILAVDAPELVGRHAPAFRALLTDLGIGSFADLARRRAETAALVPAVWAVTEAIMAANPGIVEDA